MLALLLAALLPTLAVAQDFTTDLTNFGANLGPQPQAAQVPSAAANFGPAPLPDSYTLAPGDKLHLTIYGEADLSGDYPIAPDGTLALPLVGTLRVAGQTVAQAQTLITRRYASGYLRNPRVTLQVTASRPFYILGEVNRPGSYPWTQNLTGLGAVAIAGGYTPRAKTGKLTVRHAGTPNKPVTLPSTDPIAPGDVVEVEESFF